MVTEKKIGDKTVFLCDICGLGYSDEKTAQDCEDYCKAHPGSCSVDIPESSLFSRYTGVAKEIELNVEVDWGFEPSIQWRFTRTTLFSLHIWQEPDKVGT